MNEFSQPERGPDARWPNGDRTVAPETSMPVGSDAAPAAAADLLKNAVQGAHAGLDRLADRAAPVVRQLGDSVAAAGQTLQAKSDQWRETGDEWVEGMRATVRNRPLLSVFAAFALGALIARIPR